MTPDLAAREPLGLGERTRLLQGRLQTLLEGATWMDERAGSLAQLVYGDLDCPRIGLPPALPQAQALDHVRDLYGKELLREQARLFVSERGNGCSLAGIWHMVEHDAELQANVRKQFCTLLPHDAPPAVAGLPPCEGKRRPIDLKRNMLQVNCRCFDGAWNALSLEMDLLRDHPVFAKIATADDRRVLAEATARQHAGSRGIHAFGLAFDELFSFGSRCLRATGTLAHLVLGTTWSPQGFAVPVVGQGI